MWNKKYHSELQLNQVMIAFCWLTRALREHTPLPGPNTYNTVYECTDNKNSFKKSFGAESDPDHHQNRRDCRIPLTEVEIW